MSLRISRRKPEPKEENPEAVGQKHLARPSAQEIYNQVALNARQELKRSSVSLGISGFGGGAFMGLSAMGTALALSFLGNSEHAQLISRMFYPLGFIVVIIGRSQLFTENTLYPVALVLAERKHLWNTLRLWAVVLPSNVAGALAFALLAALTPALNPHVLEALAQLGARSGGTSCVHGVLVRGDGGMDHRAGGVAGLRFTFDYRVGDGDLDVDLYRRLGNFAHCIAASGEVFIAILTHHTGWHTYPHWFLPAVSGNICGGVLMVTILEYGQVIVGDDAKNSEPAEPGVIDTKGQGPGVEADDLRVTPIS